MISHGTPISASHDKYLAISPVRGKKREPKLYKSWQMQTLFTQTTVPSTALRGSGEHPAAPGR